MHRFILVVIFCCVGLVAAPAVFAGAESSDTLTVSPAVLNVSTFFSGGQVTVSGEVPASDDVVVEIIGPQTNSLFNLKGRIGPFWMTRDTVDLENAPALYILLLPSGSEWVQKAAGLDLGIDNIKQRVSISRTDASPEDIFRMFVKLKRSENLYDENPGAVIYSEGENGRRRFTATCHLPSSIALGQYRIKAMAIANGARDAELSAGLNVQKVGFVELVDNLATNRRLTYGVAAVLIALFSGGVMGLIFKGGGGH